MKIETFIPCRLGEPITSLFLSNSAVFFGSISGYIGKYDYIKKSLDYYPHCLSELIRDILHDDDKLYACVGDQYISVHNASDLNKESDIGYDDFKHKDLICGNYFSFIAKSNASKNITAFLALFPTAEVERLSLLKSA